MEEDSVTTAPEAETEADATPAFGTARRLWNSPVSSGESTTSENL